MAKKEKNKKRGPKSDYLKIDDDWQSAVNKALKKKRPQSGWPKEGKVKSKSK